MGINFLIKMKSISQLFFLLASVAQTQALGESSTLYLWTSSEGTSGFLAFFFLVFFAYIAFCSELSKYQCTSYSSTKTRKLEKTPETGKPCGVSSRSDQI